jgi:trigger factor
VSIEVPEAMVASDLQSRVKNTVEQFKSQGVALEQWLSATGQSTEAFIETLRTQSQTAVKVDLALRAVAVNENIIADENDINAEFERIAIQVGRKVQQVRKAYEKNDAVAELKAQIRKSKAVDWLLHNTTLVDPDGHEINASVMFGDDSHEVSADKPEDTTTI